MKSHRDKMVFDDFIFFDCIYIGKKFILKWDLTIWSQDLCLNLTLRTGIITSGKNILSLKFVWIALEDFALMQENTYQRKPVFWHNLRSTWYSPLPTMYVPPFSCCFIFSSGSIENSCLFCFKKHTFKKHWAQNVQKLRNM